jgi:hypothetical protein
MAVDGRRKTGLLVATDVAAIAATTGDAADEDLGRRGRRQQAATDWRRRIHDGQGLLLPSHKWIDDGGRRNWWRLWSSRGQR